jgi:hypothetical protein
MTSKQFQDILKKHFPGPHSRRDAGKFFGFSKNAMSTWARFGTTEQRAAWIRERLAKKWNKQKKSYAKLSPTGLIGSALQTNWPVVIVELLIAEIAVRQLLIDIVVTVAAQLTHEMVHSDHSHILACDSIDLGIADWDRRVVEQEKGLSVLQAFAKRQEASGVMARCDLPREKPWRLISDKRACKAFNRIHHGNGDKHVQYH